MTIRRSLLVPRLRRVDCSGRGSCAEDAGAGSSTSTRTDVASATPRRSGASRRPRGDRAHTGAGDPACVAGRLDLPLPMGHLQATGVDAAGRKQYRYHNLWRARRDQQKFDSMFDFAVAIPAMRRRVRRDLAGDELTRERILACATRLLDLASSASARRSTRSATTATGWPRCSSAMCASSATRSCSITRPRAGGGESRRSPIPPCTT